MNNSKSKARIYVSNLESSISKDYIYSLFLPFGPIIDVIPATDSKNGFRGFTDVQFENEEDAEAAIDNMEGAQVFGKTIHVRLSRKDSNEGPQIDLNKAVWEQDRVIEDDEMVGGE